MDIKETIKKLTLEQKANLMSGKDFWQTRDFPEHGIPSMFLADGPHGVRKQATSPDHIGLNESVKATCFPTAAAMANSWNTAFGEEMAAAIGKEALSQKVSVLLGPGLNIKRNPLCGRNFEYFSEDPYLSGKMAAAYVRGIQFNGISACLKHFAANNQEWRRISVDSVVDERTLREIYLTGFEIAVKEGKTRTIMSSYNKLNGDYTNENEHLLRDILRGEWGYDGVVVTDWGGNNDRVKGLKCGNELEMPAAGGQTTKDIIEAVRDGRLDESVLDECVERLLSLVLDTSKTLESAGEVEIDHEVHHNLARRASEESIVLLKNEGGVLPLDTRKKIAVIGDFAKKPRYQGAGSSAVNPTQLDDAVSLFSANKFNYIGYEQGYNRYGKKSRKMIEKACLLAGKSDTVLLYFGLDEVTESEGLDRQNMKLPENQIRLLDALSLIGKKIIVVLTCGAPVETSWTQKADAVIHAYLAGQAGAEAIINVLTGKVNPSGKLAESYPAKYEDCSSAAYFPGREMTAEYREGPYVGYRYYDTAGIKTAYPFGFGLSYTTFEYSNLKVEEGGVSFDIKNTGAAAGAETAQLYIGLCESKIFRPAKELKGFQKIYLEAGETKTVFMPFDGYSFRYYDISTNKWETERGEYSVMVGASSEDIRLRGTIFKEGTENTPYDKALLPSYFSGNVANIGTEEFEILLGRKVPPSGLNFYKRKRLIVDYNTTVAELRYARGFAGRFLAWGLRTAVKYLRARGKRSKANFLVMGVFSLPMRGISRMTNGAVSWAQLDGLITMFNGKFFKGLGMFRKAKKENKKRKKEAK